MIIFVGGLHRRLEFLLLFNLRVSCWVRGTSCHCTFSTSHQPFINLFWPFKSIFFWYYTLSKYSFMSNDEISFSNYRFISSFSISIVGISNRWWRLGLTFNLLLLFIILFWRIRSRSPLKRELKYLVLILRWIFILIIFNYDFRRFFITLLLSAYSMYVSCLLLVYYLWEGRRWGNSSFSKLVCSLRYLVLLVIWLFFAILWYC